MSAVHSIYCCSSPRLHEGQCIAALLRSTVVLCWTVVRGCGKIKKQKRKMFKKRVLIQVSSLQFLGQSPGPLSELIHGQLLYIFLSDVLCLRANILYFLQSTSKHFRNLTPFNLQLNPSRKFSNNFRGAPSRSTTTPTPCLSFRMLE